MAEMSRRLPALAGLAVVAGIGAERAGHRAFTRLVRRDVQALRARAAPGQAGVVTEEMLADLPEPVRRYLRYTGVVGKPFPATIRLRQTGTMRLGRGQRWVPLDAEEHYSVSPPGFVWAGTARLGPLPLDGTDHASHKEQASTIRRYIIWRNNHAYDERLRRIVAKANVA